IAHLFVEPAGLMVYRGRGPLQDRVGTDHLARDQLVADAEILQRPLSLRPPQLVGRDGNLPETVAFDPDIGHAALHLPIAKSHGKLPLRDHVHARKAIIRLLSSGYRIVDLEGSPIMIA